MDRGINYAGSIPLDTDLLSTNQNTMVALGYLAQAILGTGNLVDGLACTPTTPAGLNVLVATGSIYSLQNLEASTYGSLAADTTHQIVKQGIVKGNTTFAITPPVTAGQSMVYLVQAQYQDTDAVPVTLPYYNASNPAVPYSGPANSGTPQNTVRQGKCVLALKAGTPATTGSQTTPSPDAGYVGLYAITVANGATTITSGNITQLSTAPFFGKLPTKVSRINRQVFTSSGTYTPSAGLISAEVEVQAGGGGGAGSASGGSGTQGSNGTGGGAGGYCRKLITAATIGTSQAVTVGAAGGAGGANGSGAAGNSSSFGSILTATGGSPGAPSGPSSIIALPTAPGVGGSASGGDVNRSGGDGGGGAIFGESTAAIGGAGGTSHLGTGGRAGSLAAGNDGTGYGAGGGGAGSGGSNSYAGGAGTQGVVIVTEYLSV